MTAAIPAQIEQMMSWSDYVLRLTQVVNRGGQKTRVHAFNPLCINAKEGDTVKIIECRPLSKTKNFVVIEKIEG